MTTRNRSSELGAHPGFELGTLAAALGRERSAIAYYRNEIRKTSYFKAHFNLGQLLLKRRRFNEAIVHYKKAAQRSPDRLVAAAALNSLGVTYSKMGRSKDAVAALRMAASKDPSDPMPPTNLALEFLEVGDRVRARKWLNRALSLRKQSKEVDAEIGYVLVEGDFDVQRGTRLLEGVLRKDAKNPRTLADLAVGYMKLGNRAKASRYANRAKQLGGHDGETMRQLKRVLSAC